MLNTDSYSSNIDEAFDKTVKAHNDSKHLSDLIAKSAISIIRSIDNGGKVLTMGNGGSASDASHMASELVGRFRRERRPLPAIALTTDTSLITAIANDYGYEQVFIRQCAALLKEGDVIIAISTSGDSKNVIGAVYESKKIDSVITVGLTGSFGGDLARIVDIPIKVPSDSTPTVQEVHRTIIHIICDIVEDYYYAKK